MIKARIDKEKTLGEMWSEEDLLELPSLEMIYDIRQLKAIIHYGDDLLEFDKYNEHGQGFLHDFDIWIYIKGEAE